MAADAEEPLECEVAVIGAGPGGSVAAALLAARGVRVVLIEGSTFPRDKLCGDFISYDAAPVLNYLGVWSEVVAAGAAPIDRARVVAGRVSRTFALPMRSFALSRYILDAILLNCAIRAGALPVLGATVSSVKWTGGGHSLSLATGTATRTVHAAVVVGAWGRWSRLDLMFRRQFVLKRAPHFGLAQYGVARGRASRESVDLFAFRGGYVGAADVEENRVNLCGLVSAKFLKDTRGQTNCWLDRAADTSPLLAEEIDRSRPLSPTIRVSPPVMFSTRAAVVNNILTVGDAAVVLPPVVGGGIAAAVQTGLIAADTSLRLLARPVERVALEREYTAKIRLLLSRRMRWAGALGGLLSRPGLCENVLRLARPQIIWAELVKQTRSDLTTIERITSQWSRALPLHLDRDL